MFEESDSAALFRDLELEVVDRADSSQCEALQVALDGRNLVVQGPPGTGKSQTITNLIAAAMARGKTVLFVAEKLAALEVVRRRLRELGLGEFCLELHSHKTRKTEALEDISDRILAGSRTRPAKDYDTAREMLARRREQLSAYITIIGSPAGTMTGLTVSDALMRAGQARRKLGAEVRPFESVAANVSSGETTWATLADAKSRLAVLRNAFVELGSPDGAFAHPWAGVAAAAVMPNDAERVARLASEWADAGDRLLKLTSEPSYRGVPTAGWVAAPSNLEDLRPLRELCSNAEPLLRRVEELLDRPISRSTVGASQLHAILSLASVAPTEALDLRAPQTVAVDLVDWAEELDLRVNELRQALAQTQSVCRDAAFEADPDDLEEWSAALGQTGLFARLGGRWRAASKAWSARCRPAHLKEAASAKSEAFAALRNFLLGRTELLNDAVVNTRLGPNAQGLSTRTTHLVELTRWAASVREQLPSAAEQLISLPTERLGLLAALATEDHLRVSALLAASEPSPPADSLWASVLKASAPEELQAILHDVATDEEWAATVERCQTCAEAARGLCSAESVFAQTTMFDQKLWFSGGDPTLEGVVSRARYAAQHANKLPAWLDFDRARAAAAGQIEDARLSDTLAKAECDAGEPFFIKNLENVQGDERDVIMISMTYGPAEVGGRTPQNFGPINQGTGWRRLNVLFTRAKERMEIFSTMRSTDIVPKEGGDLGPRSLKLFLEYAETGRLGVETRDVGRATDSDFEDAVLEGLRELGFECTPQLGVANFYLDIGVRDPNAVHEFIAAVECDGAAYHSSKSARDRDRLRQEILEGLGWNVIRVWSTDWFRDPARELGRVVSELKRLVERRESQRQHLAAPSTQAKPAANEARVLPNTKLALQPSPKAPVVASTPARVVKGISVEQARAQLIDLRERAIRSAFPDVDPTRGFLRKSMLDELLRKRPTDNDEFLEEIPQPLREATDRDQVVRYREQVFDILAQIVA